MLIAGACYLINMFALILSPRLAALLFPVGMLPVLLGEGARERGLAGRGISCGRFAGDIPGQDVVVGIGLEVLRILDLDLQRLP